MKDYNDFRGVMGVYVINNTVNDKIYIGSAINVYNRIKDHLKELRRGTHKNQLLQNFYNKYGDCFYFELQIEVKTKNKDKLIHYEQIWLDRYKPYERKNGFNINKVANSMLGFKFSEESKAKMSKDRRGKKFTDEAKKNMSIAKQGDKHPRSKLREYQVLEIRNNNDGKRDYSKRMAEKHRVSWHTINYILKRKTWKHI